MAKSSNLVIEFLRLVRFEHAIMLAIAVFIAEVIVFGGIPFFTPIILLSLFAPIFSEMGSFALNDYLDVKTDRLNRKLDRPLVKGTISPKFAYHFSLFAFLVSTIIAWFINLHVLAIALIFNILAILYNFKLKDLPVLGNAYIALTMAIPFIFGNFVITTQLNFTVLILAMLGFLAGFAREIIKTVQDFKGDFRARKARTLPAVIGKASSLRVAAVLYLLFIPLTALPFFFGLSQHLLAILFVAIADLAILYNVFIVLRAKTSMLKIARNISLVALLLGLIGYLIGAIA